MKSFLKFLSLCFMYLMAMSLVGCANPNLQDLRDFVAKKKAEIPERIDPIPEIKQIDTFLYEHQGRRDPFMPTDKRVTQEVDLVENGIMPDINRRKEELENYSLDALRMVGTLQQSGITWGLVKSKEGTIHRVKNGNYMGLNHGRIVLVSEDKIEMNEIIQDSSGGYSERQASLVLTE
ncbi:MAG: pilus assembly protein PilP [Gammaproteobacteria bacterium]|nr:pilus assembly protein PilP [Gammaproteobacteria bacterium]